MASGLAHYTHAAYSSNQGFYDAAPFGSARILHMTDCHAQLLPIHFREPNVNLGFAGVRGRDMVGAVNLLGVEAMTGHWEFTYREEEVLDAQIALSPGFRWGTSVVPGEAITMDRLLDQTCITYPETYVRDMAGSELKLMLESVADNLFTPDPYFQQGGDMVRSGGLNYSCTPKATMGHRIGDLQLAGGKAIEADKTYRVAGWATVGSKSAGPPIWEVVADYLRDKKTEQVGRVETPLLKGVAGNPGIAAYAGAIQ